MGRKCHALELNRKGDERMSKMAFIFPGQGSQSAGMGKDVAEEFKEAKDIYALADQTLGYSLSSLCFEGPEEELKLTYHAQPAILTTSIALYEAMKELVPKPDYVAGHSLGEYSALVVAGSLAYTDAVSTVRKRGQYMDEAVPAGEGTMAAVLGGDRETVRQICERVTLDGETVQMANLNCPGQIVISGTTTGVQQASSKLKEARIRRVIPLSVSGPFHSELLKPAASKLSHVLEEIKIQNASIPVVANVDARPVLLAEDIQTALVEQVFSPVLWEDSIQWMIEQGVDTFVEIGPGQVLTGLMRKINKEVNSYAVFDRESLHRTAEALQ